MISPRRTISLVHGLRSLVRCRRGGFAMIYTLAAIPVFLAVGVSVDAARGYLMQTRLANAIDAAALAAGSYTGSSNSEMSELAWEFFRSNYGIDADFASATVSATGTDTAQTYRTEISAPDGSVTLNLRFESTPTDSNVFISAQTNLPTTFMRLASINDMAVAASTSVTLGQQGMELVLVMDNTGSMQGTSMTQMRLAARGLINALYRDTFDTANRYDSELRASGGDTIATLRVGLVPYVASVNIGRGQGNRTWDETDERWETRVFDDSSYSYIDDNVATATDAGSYVHWLRGVPALTLDPDGSGPEPADSPEIQQTLGEDTMPFDPDGYFTEAPRSIRDRDGDNTGYYELECLHDDELDGFLDDVLDGDEPHDLSASELFDVREELMDKINSNSLNQDLGDGRTLTDSRTVDLSDCALYSDTTYTRSGEDPITLLPPPGRLFSEDEPIYLPYDPESYVDGSSVTQLADMPTEPENGDPRGWYGCVTARRSGLDITDIPPVIDFDGDGHVIMSSGVVDPDDILAYTTATQIDTDLDGLPDSGSGLTEVDITRLGATVADTLFTPYRWPNEQTDRVGNTIYNSWRRDGLARYGDPLYYARNARRRNDFGPNSACGPPLTPLSDNYTEIMDAIAEMESWSGGGTYSNVGMAWGMRVLSPRWRSFWNISNTDGTPDTFEGVQFPLELTHQGMRKVAIVLTDGTNQTSADDFTAFGFLEDTRSATERGEHHGLLGSSPVTDANNRMVQICNAMRGDDTGRGINTPNVPDDDDIIIYTIVLASGAARSTFAACASAPEFAYYAAGPSDLATVFQQISDSLTSLRLTN